jgi:preprotein translocase subunit SecE
MEQQIIENKQQPTKQNTGVLYWVLIGILIFGGIILNNYFKDVAWSLRLAGWSILSCIVVFLFYLTREGKRLFTFAKEARVELHKVVWATRQETVQTTMIVVALVILMSVILWGMDTVLLWLVGLITKNS